MLIGLIKRIRGKDGQSMTEYAMVLVAVAVACMAAYARFGSSLTTMVSNLASLL